MHILDEDVTPTILLLDNLKSFLNEIHPSVNSHFLENRFEAFISLTMSHSSAYSMTTSISRRQFTCQVLQK